MRGRARALCVLGGLLIALVTPAAARADQTLEAEGMAVPAAQGRVVTDARASGGKVLQLWNNATASVQIDATQGYGRVWLHARGNSCNGSGPVARVSLDGHSGYVGVWSQSDFRDFETF